MRTSVEPSAIAASMSCVIPIDKVSQSIPCCRNDSSAVANFAKATRCRANDSCGAGIVISPRNRMPGSW